MKILLLGFLVVLTAVTADAATKVRQSDIDKEHITVSGVTVGVTTMASVTKRLGPAKPFNFNRQTRKKPVSALCYAGADSTKLLFVAGAEGRALKVARARITAGDVEVGYGGSCLTSKAVSGALATKSGLRVGMTRAELKSVLGEPTDENADFISYEFHLHRALTAPEVARIEVEWPKVRLYPYHDISSSIEARFVDGVVKRLDIIRFSTY